MRQQDDLIWNMVNMTRKWKFFTHTTATVAVHLTRLYKSFLVFLFLFARSVDLLAQNGKTTANHQFFKKNQSG